MTTLPAIQAVAVSPTPASWRDGSARAAQAAPSLVDLVAWRGEYEDRTAAWNAWRARQPAAGYVVQRLAQATEGGDPSLTLRGRAAYAAAAARSATIEGPVGTVSLLV